MITYLEIQKRKEEMKKQKYCNELKATSTCTKRIANHSCSPEHNLQEIDRSLHVKPSWCGDVPFARVEAVHIVSSYRDFVGTYSEDQ